MSELVKGIIAFISIDLIISFWVSFACYNMPGGEIEDIFKSALLVQAFLLPVFSLIIFLGVM